MAKKVAFLGLGNMGGPMSANLVKAGFEVHGFDPLPAARERARKNNVTCFDSPAEAARGVQVVCSSVLGTEEAIEAYLGEKGVLSIAVKGMVCFDFSTISLEGSRRIGEEAEKKGVRFLDTPVSGSVPHAEAGTLAVLAGGDASAIQEHRDVLETVGKEVHHFGPRGAGLRMKLVTNQILGIYLAAIAEGLTLGKKSGLDPEAMVRFLKSSALPKLLDYKANLMAVKDYRVIATTNIMVKDLKLVAAFAEEMKVPIPMCSTAWQAFMGAAALGYGDQDMNAVIEYFEKGAGIAR